MAQHDVNRFRTLLDRVDPENLTDFLALNWAHLDLPSDQLDRKVNTQATHVVHDQLLDTLIKACHSSIHGNVWITGNHTSTDGSNTQKPLGRQRARRASFDTTRGAVLDHILQPYDFEASADATTCLETGNASITTSQFRNITRAGIQGWFEDATIDLASTFSDAFSNARTRASYFARQPKHRTFTMSDIMLRALTQQCKILQEQITISTIFLWRSAKRLNS
jgi:hypothetical protein